MILRVSSSIWDHFLRVFSGSFRQPPFLYSICQNPSTLHGNMGRLVLHTHKLSVPC